MAPSGTAWVRVGLDGEGWRGKKIQNCDVVKGNMSLKTEEKHFENPTSSHTYSDMEQVWVKGYDDGGTSEEK